MKKILTTILLFFGVLVSNAQYTVYDNSGIRTMTQTEINDLKLKRCLIWLTIPFKK